MKNLKRAGGVLLALAMALSMAACGSKETTQPENPTSGEVSGADTVKSEIPFLTFAASDSGGEWYTMSVAVNTILEDKLGIATSVGPGGGQANIYAVQNGEAQFGWSNTATLSTAVAGDAPFDDGVDYSDLRMVFSAHPGPITFVTLKDSNITSLSQIEGKNIALGPTGAMSNTVALALLEEEYGITEESVAKAGGTISYLAYAEGGDALKDGDVDIWITQGPYPASWLQEIDLNPGIAFVSIEEEHLTSFLARHTNWVSIDVPAGSYDSMDKDYTTIGSWNIVLCSASLSEESVYEIVKAMWENIQVVWDASSTAARFMDPEHPANGLGALQLHPGAEKYYKEISAEY